MKHKFLGVLIITLNSLYIGAVTSLKDDVFCGKLHVSLTISPILKDRKSRYLEVSWTNAEPQFGDWVGLFTSDPNVGELGRALIRVPVTQESNWIRTGVTQDAVMTYETLDFTPTCLGAWVAYMRSDNTTIVASNCLRTEPTWMADMKDLLKETKLRQVFIPGTHDTGAYRKQNALESLVSKYSFTQEEDVLSQLIYGVRYLDIRVGYYPSREENWWVNHGVARIHPLRTVLDDVKTFMEHTNEIVILDFHEFPKGFGRNAVHNLLEAHLKSELSSLAASPSLTWEVSLDDLWRTGKRLIVSYNEDDIVRKSDLLWPGVQHQWGNKDNLRDLQRYLSGARKNPPRSKPWAAMAELTPSTWQVVLDQLGGLRKMADGVNRNVTEWYRGDWGKNVNIVALDFFRSSDIVESAILWNRRRASGNTTCHMGL